MVFMLYVLAFNNFMICWGSSPNTIWTYPLAFNNFNEICAILGDNYACYCTLKSIKLTYVEIVKSSNVYAHFIAIGY